MSDENTRTASCRCPGETGAAVPTLARAPPGGPAGGRNAASPAVSPPAGHAAQHAHEPDHPEVHSVNGGGRDTAHQARRRRCSEYDAAVSGILRLLPPMPARALRWLLSPPARWIRIPAALLCFVFSLLWFLPVIGLEYLPIGLVLMARDIRPLQRPVGRLLLWTGRWLARARQRWSSRRLFRRTARAQERSGARTGATQRAQHPR